MRNSLTGACWRVGDGLCGAWLELLDLILTLWSSWQPLSILTPPAAYVRHFRSADGSLVESISQSLTKILGQNVKKIVIVARFSVVVSISLDFHGLVVAV
jgi:hypothetical protein